MYGWGLYGSNVRGVAEGYMKNGIRDPRVMAKNFLAANKTAEAAIKALKEGLKINKSVSEEVKKTARKAIKILQSGESIPETIGNLYEQTFFTDRALGDESHLLKWYEPVTREQMDWIESRLKAEGIGNVNMPFLKGELPNPDNPLGGPANAKIKNGRTVYDHLANKLGSPKAASEFLARAGIDGVKYPVDSYGGKGVKDGDEAGWDYVAFSDEHIRVDHKWTDGQMRFSLKAGTASDYSWAALTAKPNMLLAQIDPEKFKNYTKDSERIADARRSIVEAGGHIVGKEAVIQIEGADVIVGADGIKHRGRRRNNENDMLFPVLGEVMKNAVRVNELEPRTDQKGKKENGKSKKDDKVTDVFVYLGAFAHDNEVCPVRIQISQLEGVKKLDRIDVLKSLNTKIGRFASPANTDFGRVGHVGSGPVAHLPNISISNLIRIAQPLHPDIFSRDVAANLNVQYSGDKLGARYSIAGEEGAELLPGRPRTAARR